MQRVLTVTSDLLRDNLVATQRDALDVAGKWKHGKYICPPQQENSRLHVFTLISAVPSVTHGDSGSPGFFALTDQHGFVHTVVERRLDNTTVAYTNGNGDIPECTEIRHTRRVACAALDSLAKKRHEIFGTLIFHIIKTIESSLADHEVARLPVGGINPMEFAEHNLVPPTPAHAPMQWLMQIAVGVVHEVDDTNTFHACRHPDGVWTNANGFVALTTHPFILWSAQERCAPTHAVLLKKPEHISLAAAMKIVDSTKPRHAIFLI